MMLLYYLRNLYTERNGIIAEKITNGLINSTSLLNLNKYYLILSSAILILIFPFLFFIINSSFADSNNVTSIINSTEILFNKANNFYQQEKYDEAIQYYDKVLAINPTYVEALNNKALVFYDLKKYDEAIQYYDKVLARDPTYVEALNNKPLF